MIAKIIAGDVFSAQLQSGESPERPIDIIAGTNQVGKNTKGVVHEIGQVYHRDFLNLLEKSKCSEVPLGHVFSREGMIGGGSQKANFHAIAVNRREQPEGPQDWSQLLESLTTGLDYLHVNQNTYEDSDTVDDPGFIDVELRDKINLIPIQEGVDYATQVSALVKEHIASTRRKYRAVLVGGDDGLKNQANLQHTLEAFESSGLILHLYLLHNPAVAAIKKVIPFIPALKERELLVRAS